MSDKYNQAYSYLLIAAGVLLVAAILTFTGGIASYLRFNTTNIRLNSALAEGNDAALDASAKELGELLVDAPHETDAWRGIALAHITQDQLAAAVEAYAHIENAEAELVDWGRRAELEKRWDRAQDWYQVAVLLVPENGDHLYKLARVLAEQGQPEAMDYYTQALAAPQRAEFGRSNILTRMGELEKRDNTPIIWRDVLTRYDEAIQLDEFVDPGDIIQAWMGKAEAFERLGQSRAALEAYEWLAAYSPGHYWANVHAGRLAWQAEMNTSRAISYLDKAIEIDGRPKWAHLYLAQVYAQLGENDRAIPLFRKVLEIDPEDRAARAHLSQLENSDGY